MMNKKAVSLDDSASDVFVVDGANAAHHDRNAALASSLRQIADRIEAHHEEIHAVSAGIEWGDGYEFQCDFACQGPAGVVGLD